MVENVGADLDSKDSVREAMLVHLCDRSDAHFKSQQLGEPELTRHQKWQIAEELLDKSKPQFLARFAQHLLPEHTRYFKGTRAFDGEGESNAEDDYTVKFYLEEIERRSSPPKKQAEVKNRRLEALKRLIIKGEYFSESEMKKRNPLLYEELVGKYLSEDEKIKRNDFDYSGATLSRVLLEKYDRDMTQKLMEKQLEEYDSDMATNDDEDLDVEESDDLWGETKVFADAYRKDRRHHKALQDKQRRVKDHLRMRHHFDDEEVEEDEDQTEGGVSETEKKMMFEEFRSHMFTSFLQGKDDFDYPSVDANADYDDLDELGRDSEEKYFDSESPTETTTYMETEETMDAQDKDGVIKSTEDELDNFMKEINKL